MSISDIMERLYGRSGRFVMNAASLIPPVGLVTLQFTALLYLYKYFIGGEYYMSWFLLTVAILAFYSCMGGIKAVVFTDVVQFFTFFFAIPYTCAHSLWDIGGYQALVDNLPEKFFTIEFNHDNTWFLVTIIFYTLIPLADGASIQRFLMASSPKQLTKVLLGCAFCSLILAAVLVLIGYIIRVKAPDIEGGEALYYLMHHYLPPGVKGLMIAGMLAVLMSTADSWLNTASVLYAHDIAKRIWPSMTEKQELYLARLATLTVAAAATFFALNTGSLIGAIWAISNFWSPMTLIPLVCGFLGFRTNERSFVITTIFAVSMTVWSAYHDGGYLAPKFATFSFTMGVVSSFVCFFVCHFWHKIFRPESVRGLSVEKSEHIVVAS